MSETNQLAAHYAVLQIDALLDAGVMHYRRLAELIVEEFWERYPQCGRDARRLDAAGKSAHAAVVDLLRAKRGNAVRDARTLLALRAQCGTDKDDLPELDDAVLAEFRRLTNTDDADRRERQAAAALEEKRRAARADDDKFDAGLEEHFEGLFDYANGEGPGPWFAATREGGAL